MVQLIYSFDSLLTVPPVRKNKLASANSVSSRNMLYAKKRHSSRTSQKQTDLVELRTIHSITGIVLIEEHDASSDFIVNARTMQYFSAKVPGLRKILYSCLVDRVPTVCPFVMYLL